MSGVFILLNCFLFIYFINYSKVKLASPSGVNDSGVWIGGVPLMTARIYFGMPEGKESTVKYRYCGFSRLLWKDV